MPQYQPSATTKCTNPDVNCDGVINLNVLLVLLVHFSIVDSNGDGVGEVEVECIKDKCGVCDGPGPQVLVIDTIAFSLGSIYVEALNAWEVYQIPDTTFTYVCSNQGCTDATAPRDLCPTSWRGVDQGVKMKAVNVDSPGWNGASPI